MGAYPWNGEVATEWLDLKEWTLDEAAAILLADTHPADGVNGDTSKRLLDLVRPLLDPLPIAMSVMASRFPGHRSGLPPRRWIELLRLAGESIGTTVEMVLEAKAPLGEIKQLRKDKLLTHQRIIVALSQMGPVDLEAPDAAKKIMQKRPGRSLDTVTKAIKAAAKAVRIDELRYK